MHKWAELIIVMGANMWDGAEQAQFPASDTRRSTVTFEIHMSTVRWKISDEHNAKRKNNVGNSFKIPPKSHSS